MRKLAETASDGAAGTILERTRLAWRDEPERFGPWQTVYKRKRRWAVEGIWQGILQALQGDFMAQGLRVGRLVVFERAG